MILFSLYRFRTLRSLLPIGLGLALLLLSSCNSLFIDEQKPNTVQNNFDLLWQIFDERYCYFAEKEVDWHMMYDKHFPNLSLNNVSDPNSPRLFHHMASMLAELRDGHVSIDNGDATRSYTDWYSSYPENFNSSLIRTYRNTDVQTVYLNNETTISILPESIGYIRCPSFSDKFNRNDLDNAMSRFKNVKGVIIDVRNNGGGLVSEAYMLASRFAREKTHVGYIRYKTGKGHHDFSDYFARYVEPDGAHPFYGKIAIIANRRVYSAGNMFVSFMSNLPHVRIIGDNTGGGGGMPVSAELYNGWTVKLSSNPVFDVNKQSLESGVKPDYPVALNTNTNNTQRDNIIEYAKTWILAN